MTSSSQPTEASTEHRVDSGAPTTPTPGQDDVTSADFESRVHEVVERARFPRGQVDALLAAARATGQEVVLAKDEGAYLMTFTADGAPDQETLTYAVGHAPPPRVGPTDPRHMTPDDPWIVARVATEMVWGGDDFSEDFTVEELASALTGEELTFELVLEEVPATVVAAHLPPSLWGRTDPIRHLVELRLLGAPQTAR